MKVCAVWEDNHGLIGVCANNPKAIVDYLITSGWVNEKTNIFIDKFNQWVPLRSYFGQHWSDRLMEMDMETLVDTFADCFEFETYNVSGYEKIDETELDVFLYEERHAPSYLAGQGKD